MIGDTLESDTCPRCTGSCIDPLSLGHEDGPYDCPKCDGEGVLRPPPDPCEHGVEHGTRCYDCRPLGHRLDGDQVTIDHEDESDPFALISPATFTEDEADDAVRSLDTLDAGGQCERWEATRRALVEENQRLRRAMGRVARALLRADSRGDMYVALTLSQNAEALGLALGWEGGATLV